jgi:sorting nexin-8
MMIRQNAAANDHEHVSRILAAHGASSSSFAAHSLTAPSVRMTLTTVSRFFNQCSSIMIDESRGWEASILEDLKRERDSVVSMREMLDRWERTGGNNIPSLEKRILSNEGKVETLRSAPVPKPNDIAKTEESIIKDRETIVILKQRHVFVKKSILEEIEYFYALKTSIPKLWNEFSVDKVKYAELLGDNWRAMEAEVQVSS